MNILLGILTIISIAVADDKSKGEHNYIPQTGDIIGHTSLSGQSDMIKYATLSRFTHVGVVVVKNGKTYVAEASGTTRYVPIETFIDRGKNDEYRIIRKNADLTNGQKHRIKREIDSHIGKRYDLAFRWSDSKMYCSELVWKAYDAAGIKLSDPKTFNDFPGVHIPKIRKVMEKRWGGNVNLEEKVVSPKEVMHANDFSIVEGAGFYF